ncbi:MAG: DUF1707 and DUF2154 domain-containing protein [Spirochaetales bacterium]|nr:DUF1707 and DUF2154 domain-containing protein [Spirochaetales bacterium]
MSKELDIGISKIARQKVIDHLKHAYAKDYLEDDDFEKRLDIATNTRNRADLIELVEDIPVEDINQAPPAGQTQPDSALFSINRGNVPESDNFISVFSGVTRKGEWRPAKNIKSVAIMGGVDLDFSKALIPPGGISITIFAFMGGVDIRVPEGVNVINDGLAFMGGFENHVHGATLPGAPTIHIKGFTFMGGVEIKGPRKPNVLRRIINKILE